MNQIFHSLGLPAEPHLLAPLAGVSDHPFRRVCVAQGADLSYVEMISATALVHNSERTLAMLKRHPDESRLGVQITGISAEETARGIAILDRYSFETIDINMGCPVKKVVKTGCGSAILRDPERVYQTLRLARAATSKPVSCKIRLGWDRQSMNAVEVAQAAASGGAVWITVHGRTRADDYGVPVDLDFMARVRAAVAIPVLGNGNVFSQADGNLMRAQAGTPGLMVSRGALGNPWVFRQLKGDLRPVTLSEWRDLVLWHCQEQAIEYGERGAGALCMRKHLLWYASGWPGARKLREQINQTETLATAKALIEAFCDELAAQGVDQRFSAAEAAAVASRFSWDPKFDMDRQLDRGVGDDGLCAI